MTNKRKLLNSLRGSALRPLFYGCVTGTVCGIVLSLFLVCSRIVFSFSAKIYKLNNMPLVIACVLILSVMCCLLTAVVQTLCAAAKGSGIPLAEARARGMLRVGWLKAAAALIVGSLLAFLAGMPLGSEGPCVGVGGLIGDGIGSAAKKKDGFSRYLVTGGACAGLAAAFNAPLTGLCFAFEEAHRRFSPYILISALSAVIFSVAASQAIFFGLEHVPYLADIGVAHGHAMLSYMQQSPVSGKDLPAVCGIAALCGLVCSGFGIAFNRGTIALGKLFGKIKNPILRLLPAFLLAAVCGLIVPIATGSGEALIEHAFAGMSIGLLFALLAVRFVSTSIASGSGATGGLFIPMIAIGALIGIIAAKACTACGLNAAYVPNIVLLCICAYFAASVRAPITALALSLELTASYVNLLPCLIAITVASVIAELTKTDPLYETMLEKLQAENPIPNAKNMTVTGVVRDGSPIARRRVRNILWPYNTLVIGLKRDGRECVPDGETKLLTGDVLTFSAESVDPDEFMQKLDEYVEVQNN